MRENTSAYGLPRETLTAIMVLDKNMKAMVHLLNGGTDFLILSLESGTISVYKQPRLHNTNINRSDERK